jgi:integrase
MQVLFLWVSGVDLLLICYFCNRRMGAVWRGWVPLATKNNSKLIANFMASILIKLDRRRANAEGNFPVKLVIVNNQTNAALSLSYCLPEKAWEGDGLQRPVKASYPGSKLINDRIERFYMDVRDALIGLEHSEKDRGMKAVDIKRYVLARKSDTAGSAVDFYDYAKSFIEGCRAKKTKEVYEYTVSKLKGLMAEKSLLFSEMNYAFLRLFDDRLYDAGSGVNTRSIHFRNIRALFNLAIDDDVIEQNLYPFRKFKIKNERRAKECLTVEQVKQLHGYAFKTAALCMARDYWMLSFFLCGANPVDLYFMKKPDGAGRLTFIRQKEMSASHDTIKLLLQPEAKLIAERYGAEEDSEYLLGFESKYVSYDSFKHFVSKKIREIAGIMGFAGMTLYWARYSWATIADGIGVDEKTISKGLGHVDKTMAGRHYIAFDWTKVDRANRRVIDFVLGARGLSDGETE